MFAAKNTKTLPLTTSRLQKPRQVVSRFNGPSPSPDPLDPVHEARFSLKPPALAPAPALAARTWGRRWGWAPRPAGLSKGSERPVARSRAKRWAAFAGEKRCTWKNDENMRPRAGPGDG
jgi:hypothetical protein